MESQVKNKLIYRPFFIGIASTIFGLFFVFLLEYVLTNMLQAVSKTEQQFHFPVVMYIALPVAFSLPAIKALAKNALSLKSWKQGDAPSCPECNFPMVERVAKKGRFVGQSFWGCYRYPKCSGKIHIG